MSFLMLDRCDKLIPRSVTETRISAFLELLDDLVDVLPRPHDELLEEVSPAGEVKVDGAAGDLPEGQGRVYGRHFPGVKQPGLPEPLVTLCQGHPLALGLRASESVAKFNSLQDKVLNSSDSPCEQVKLSL